MTYLDNNQDKNILDELVVSKFEILPPLLEIINKNPNITQNALRKTSKYSGGKIYQGVKAMKTMKLVENGYGLRLTELGEQFLAFYNSDEEKFRGVLRISCLNAPLFKKIYEKNREIKEPKILFGLLKKELEGRYENINSKLLGSSIRRYLRGIHNIKLRVGAKIQPDDNNLINKTISKKREDNIVESIRGFKKVLNLSDRELHQIINGLPEKKREEVLSNIFSKVFK